MFWALFSPLTIIVRLKIHTTDCAVLVPAKRNGRIGRRRRRRRDEGGGGFGLTDEWWWRRRSKRRTVARRNNNDGNEADDDEKPRGRGKRPCGTTELALLVYDDAARYGWPECNAQYRRRALNDPPAVLRVGGRAKVQRDVVSFFRGTPVGRSLTLRPSTRNGIARNRFSFRERSSPPSSRSPRKFVKTTDGDARFRDVSPSDRSSTERYTQNNKDNTRALPLAAGLGFRRSRKTDYRLRTTGIGHRSRWVTFTSDRAWSGTETFPVRVWRETR